jgi:hypothetical protein
MMRCAQRNRSAVRGARRGGGLGLRGHAEAARLGARPDAAFPDGGGHRLLGRSARARGWGQLGYDHFEVVVDEATRLAYVAHVPNESAASASRALLDAAVWFAERGVRIERVMTDNA